MPSEPLREELQAAILRVAKRRFTARKRRWDAVRPSVEDNNQADDEEESEDDDEGQGGDEGEDDEYPGAAARPRRPRTFDPVVSADDDLSHALLAPSVSHAITNLDATLRILHHTRPTNGGYDSDSSTASERGKGREEKQKGKDKEKEDKEKEKAKEKEKEKEREKRKKERAHKTTNRGRPRKAHVPLDGETPEEMMLRVARENHRRVADIKRDLEFEAWMRGDSQELAEEVEGQDVKGEVAEQDEQDEQDEQEEEEEQEEQDAQPSSSESDTKEPTPPPRRTREKKRPEKRPRDRRELGLRDWSDVLGAAALAGFHPSVVARAAQRCSSLFGEGMTLRTLHEVPMPRGAPTSTGMHTASIKPLHNTRHNANDDTSEDDLSSTPSVVSRRSQPRSRRTTPSPRFGTPASSSRSRSRSASAGGLQHFCSVPGCPRAARGFPRRANLKRHVVLVHGGDTGTGRMPSSSPPGTAGGAATDPVDSDDEVVGAVHVDGFLRPVSPGRGGWQGAGWGTPTRKRKRNKARRRSSDDEHMQYDGESD